MTDTAAPERTADTCRDCSQLIDERDRAENAADELAHAIADYFGSDVGEHSNLNCPWTNALNVILAASDTRTK